MDLGDHYALSLNLSAALAEQDRRRLVEEESILAMQKHFQENLRRQEEQILFGTMSEDERRRQQRQVQAEAQWRIRIADLEAQLKDSSLTYKPKHDPILEEIRDLLIAADYLEEKGIQGFETIRKMYGHYTPALQMLEEYELQNNPPTDEELAELSSKELPEQ